MARAYPMELRERVIEALNNGEGTYEELAKRFRIGVATVDRWAALDRQTGSIVPRPVGGARQPPKLTPDAQRHVIEVLEERPESTLGELAAAVEARFGISMSERTMGRSLDRLGITRKRGLSVHLRRSGRTLSRSGKPSSPP